MKNKTAYLGLFTAVGILLGYVESLLPVFVSVPGVKIGLANLAAMLALYLFGWKEAVIVSLLRILAVGFLFGNLFSILFSMAGGAVSILVMILLKRSDKFSPVGVSIAGGVAHNIGQILIAALILESEKVFYYLPVLLISGLVAGALIGILGGEMIKRLKKVTKL